MFRKTYKLKKKRKLINPYHIFLLFAISLLFVVCGYSFFSDSLNITGRANILQQSNHEYGDSTYTWWISEDWPENEGHTYRLFLHIVNLDEDFNLWEISFDVPNGYRFEPERFYDISEASYSGNTLTLKSPEYYVWHTTSVGSSLEISFILPFDAPVDNFAITNIVLNGRYVNEISN